MLTFGWLSRRASPPARWDLRHLGWDILRPDHDADEIAAEHAPCTINAVITRAPVTLIDWRADSTLGELQPGTPITGSVAVGLDSASERVGFLQRGFGDALPSQVALVELAERMLKVAQRSFHLPRQRWAGPIRLDLFHRDGRCHDRWIGLHPREFALLWRLAEAGGARVTRKDLLADVWRVDHDIETNSLEVHVSRLRSKLAVFACSWVVHTDPRGGYRLAHDAASKASALPLGPAKCGEEALILGENTPQTALTGESENDDTA